MPQMGTWPITQARALAWNRTGDLSVHRPALNPLSHTSQDRRISFAPGWSDCLTCFWEFFGGCPCLGVLCCSEVFPGPHSLRLEAATEVTWILGTEDLVTNACVPAAPVDSTVPTQTTSEE